MNDTEFFANMRRDAEAEIRRSEKLDSAFDAFRDELRKAILNEDIDMIFEPYTGTCKGYWAEIIVTVRHNFVIKLTLNENFVCYGIDSWLEGLFDGCFDELTALAHRHIEPLTADDVQRIKELEHEIDIIKNKQIH